jgi:hypothetical protein
MLIHTTIYPTYQQYTTGRKRDFSIFNLVYFIALAIAQISVE